MGIRELSERIRLCPLRMRKGSNSSSILCRGELTPHLYKLQKDDTLLCRRISKGRFTLDVKSGRTRHLLLATVTGIAPFVSYARTLYRDWKSGGSPMPGDHKLYCLLGASRFWDSDIVKSWSASLRK